MRMVVYHRGSCLACPYEEGNVLHESDEPEESSTEPPVPDEPFVVLCVPQEDELSERIQR